MATLEAPSTFVATQYSPPFSSLSSPKLLFHLLVLSLSGIKSSRQRGHSAMVRPLSLSPPHVSLSDLVLTFHHLLPLPRLLLHALQDFKSATTGVAAKAMRNELTRMVAGVQDPAQKKVSLTSGPASVSAALSQLRPVPGQREHPSSLELLFPHVLILSYSFLFPSATYRASRLR